MCTDNPFEYSFIMAVFYPFMRWDLNENLKSETLFSWIIDIRTCYLWLMSSSNIAWGDIPWHMDSKVQTTWNTSASFFFFNPSERFRVYMHVIACPLSSTKLVNSKRIIHGFLVELNCHQLQVEINSIITMTEIVGTSPGRQQNQSKLWRDLMWRYNSNYMDIAAKY